VKGFLCFELTLQDWKVSGGLPPARGV